MKPKISGKTGNPQLKNGYMPVANELVDALCRIRISGECGQILWAVFRKTYGYRKKEDAIPLSQFSSLTGLPKSTVVRAINKLISMNLIIKVDINKYCINKNYMDWLPAPKKTRGVRERRIKEAGYKKENESFTKLKTEGYKKENESFTKLRHSKDNVKYNFSKDKSRDAFLRNENQELKKAIAEKAVLLRDWQGFNVFQLIQRHVNSRCPPELTDKVLSQLLKNREGIKNPWAYVDAIMKTELGNFNAEISRLESEEYKKQEAGFIGEVLKRAAGYEH